MGNYSINPRLPFVLLIIFTSGCMLGESGIRRGTPITHVQAEFGVPDVISDASGDQVRLYVPTKRPAYEWPADAPRTFYYLNRNLAAEFVSGKVVSAVSIDPDMRESILLPLLRRHNANVGQALPDDQ